MERFLIIIKKSKNNYGAYAPDVPGCIATGVTLEETIERMDSALHFHFEGLQEDGDPLPTPKPFQQHIDEIDASVGDIFAFLGIEMEALAA